MSGPITARLLDTDLVTPLEVTPGDEGLMPLAFGHTAQLQLDDIGTVSLKLPHGDPHVLAAGEGSAIELLIDGGPIPAVGLVETPTRHVIDPDDEHGEIVELSLRGIAAVLERAVVYPEGGLGHLPIGEDRYFDWRSPSFPYTGILGWAAVAHVIEPGSSIQAQGYWGGPAAWTDPAARWIWPSIPGHPLQMASVQVHTDGAGKGYSFFPTGFGADANIIDPTIDVGYPPVAGWPTWPTAGMTVAAGNAVVDGQRSIVVVITGGPANADVWLRCVYSDDADTDTPISGTFPGGGWIRPSASGDVAYFRKTFSAPVSGQEAICFIVGATGMLDLYLDGVLILQLDKSDHWTQATRVDVIVTAGQHMLAARVEHTQVVGVPYGGFLLSASVMDPATGAPSPRVIVRTDDTWVGHLTDEEPPGMNPGQIMRLLLDEAQARSTLPTSLDVEGAGSDNHDANDVVWLPAHVSIPIGNHYIDALRALVDAGATHWRMNGLAIRMWQDPPDPVLVDPDIITSLTITDQKPITVVLARGMGAYSETRTEDAARREIFAALGEARSWTELSQQAREALDPTPDPAFVLAIEPGPDGRPTFRPGDVLTLPWNGDFTIDVILAALTIAQNDDGALEWTPEAGRLMRDEQDQRDGIERHWLRGSLRGRNIRTGPWNPQPPPTPRLVRVRELFPHSYRGVVVDSVSSTPDALAQPFALRSLIVTSNAPDTANIHVVRDGTDVAVLAWSGVSGEELICDPEPFFATRQQLQFFVTDMGGTITGLSIKPIVRA